MSAGALPDPNTLRLTPAPEGYHYEWAVEQAAGRGAWRVVPPEEARQCRQFERGVRCAGRSEAKLRRSQDGNPEQWWHYCGRHLYGRAVEGQRVWFVRLVPDDDHEHEPARWGLW